MEHFPTLHARMPAILVSQQEIDEWLDYGRYKTEQVLPLLKPHDDIQMYRVTPNIGSTKVNDVNNIRPMKSDTSNVNTLDSFVIKKAPKRYFEDLPLNDRTNKRNPSSTDDPPSKPPAKRLKK